MSKQANSQSSVSCQIGDPTPSIMDALFCLFDLFFSFTKKLRKIEHNGFVFFRDGDIHVCEISGRELILCIEISYAVSYCTRVSRVEILYLLRFILQCQ